MTDNQSATPPAPQWQTQYVKRHQDHPNQMDVTLTVEFNNYFGKWVFNAWDYEDLEPSELRTPLPKDQCFDTPELAMQAADEWFPRWVAYYNETSDPDMPDDWQPTSKDEDEENEP